jgi:hypothetical protein
VEAVSQQLVSLLVRHPWGVTEEGREGGREEGRIRLEEKRQASPVRELDLSRLPGPREGIKIGRETMRMRGGSGRRGGKGQGEREGEREGGREGVQAGTWGKGEGGREVEESGNLGRRKVPAREGGAIRIPCPPPVPPPLLPALPPAFPAVLPCCTYLNAPAKRGCQSFSYLLSDGS